VDAQHKTGLLSLKEAMREAVNAEVCRSELPYGAVPILAIIDTGFTHRLDASAPEERCAIVVRPNFIRPAHFERNIFFGDSGTPASHQFRDACRVRDAVRTLDREPDLYPSVREMFTRFARQLGTARAQRLWQGRFLSSNLSIDGAFVDFGAFRATPNWRRCVGLAGEVFGTEIGQLRRAFASVLYYYAKYSTADELGFEVKPFYAELAQIEDRAFLDGCLAGLGVPRDRFQGQSALEGLLLAYYRQQQATPMGDSADGDPFSIYELLCGRRSLRAAPGADRVIAEQLIAELDRLERAGLPVSRSRTRAFFEPRRLLNYATSVAAASDLERRLDGAADPADLVGRHIEAQYSASIRAWRAVPAELEVLRQATDIASAVLVCRDLRSGELELRMQGPEIGGRLHLLGRTFETEGLERARAIQPGQRTTYRQRLAGDDPEAWRIAGQGLELSGRLTAFAEGAAPVLEAAA
jgi:hypothetical protein